MHALLAKVLEEAGNSLFKDLTIAFVGSTVASAGQALGAHLVNKVVQNKEEIERDRVRLVLHELALMHEEGEQEAPQEEADGGD